MKPVIILKNQLSILFLLFVAEAFSAVFAGDASAGYSQYQKQISDLVSLARSNNPRLKAFEAREKSLEASASGYRAIDPPLLTVDFMQAPVQSFPNPIKNQMEIDYGIEQMIIFPGKPAGMRKAGQERSRAAHYDKSTAEQQIITGIKTAYHELYLIDRKQSLLAEKRKYLQGAVDLSQSQYQTGIVGQADVLRAQVELASVVTDSIALVNDWTSALAMLVSYLGTPQSSAITGISDINLPPLSFNQDSLVSLAFRNRPELKQMEAMLAMAKQENKTARQDYVPDLMLKAAYKDMQDSPDDYWELMAGITVPFAPWSYKRSSGQQAQTRQAVIQAEQELENMKNMVQAQVISAWAHAVSAGKKSEVQETIIIPKSQQALEASQTGYRNGKADILMVLDNVRMVIDARQEYYMSIMELLNARAELELAVGLPIDKIPQTASSPDNNGAAP